MNIKAPYLPIELIKPHVDELRSQYPALNKYPINIELFAEDIGIEIIPVAGLIAADTEAFITQDFLSIVVDAEKYRDDKFYNRLRFSIAHEIGHKFLHQSFFEHNRGTENSEFGWLNFMNSLSDSQYSFLEQHANNFAGMLLVPAEELVRLVLEENKRDHFVFASYFGVSKQTIERRVTAADVSAELRDKSDYFN